MITSPTRAIYSPCLQEWLTSRATKEVSRILRPKVATSVTLQPTNPTNGRILIIPRESWAVPSLWCTIMTRGTSSRESFTIFSFNHICVWTRFPDFQVPARTPPCPPRGCAVRSSRSTRGGEEMSVCTGQLHGAKQPFDWLINNWRFPPTGVQ